MTVKSIRRQTILPTRGTSRQSPDERHSSAHSHDDMQQPVKAPPPADMGHYVDKTV